MSRYDCMKCENLIYIKKDIVENKEKYYVYI